MTQELVAIRRINRFEVAVFAEEGFITLEPHYWEDQTGQGLHIRQGLMYRIPAGHLDDLIAMLQAARHDLCNPSAGGAPPVLND